MNDILIAGQTDVGQRRKDNQDTFICTMIWSEASALLVVIDGVGGYAGGDRAAAIARESIERYMAAPNGDPLTMLREAVVFANNQINDQRQQDLKLAQMCCVLTAAIADATTGKLYFVHVGDTRLYRFRQDTLEKLTSDHSLVGIREDANELTETEAMQHPRRNEILREVGSAAHRVDDPDFLESGETDFLPDDLLLLCSDGLTDMITQAQITGILNRRLSLDKQIDGLIKLANTQGGNDNITVVLAKNQLKSPEPAATAKAVPASRVRLLDMTPVAVESGSVPTPVLPPSPKKRTSVGVWVTMLVVLLAGIGGLVWYQSAEPEHTAVAADSLATTVVSSSVAAPVSKPSRLDSLLQTAYHSADHRLVLPTDTIRLSQPLDLTDSLLTIVGGNPQTVLVPADTTQSEVALRVIGSGAVTLENLVIRGFRIGIQTNGPSRLQLKNVYFRQTDIPINATVRQDTFRTSQVILSVQDQPVPAKSVPTKPLPRN